MVELDHTKNASKQKEAYRLLNVKGPLTYEEMKAHLGYESELMQSVMRGLKDNGLIRSEVQKTSERYYTVKERHYIGVKP